MNASSGRPSLVAADELLGGVAEARLGQAVGGDQAVVPPDVDPVRPAVEAEPGRSRGGPRTRRGRPRRWPARRGQRFEIGLQLVGLLRCADRHQLLSRRCSDPRGSRPDRRCRSLQRGRVSTARAYPDRRRGPEGANRCRPQVAVRRTAPPPADTNRSGSASGSCRLARRWSNFGPPSRQVYSKTRKAFRPRPAGDALVDVALEAESERGRLMVQHRLQRRAGVERPSSALQRRRSAAAG